MYRPNVRCKKMLNNDKISGGENGPAILWSAFSIRLLQAINFFMTHNEICVYGDLEVLPVLCDLDYCTAKTHHAVLLRDQTLAEGGEKCDYWFVGDQVKDPQ